LKNVSLININNNEAEKYILLNTNLQLNILTKATQLFIDTTFKIASKS
jgi:hypothetical protein